MLLNKFSTRKRELQHLPKAILSRYYCEKPRQLQIELSNRCNLQCGMCWVHGEAGLGDRSGGEELSTREVFDLVEQLAGYNPQLEIYLGGGEPYVREDFATILRHITSLNLSVSFATNGTLLDPERLQELVAIGPDRIDFSIDGWEELHDRQRGAGGFRTVTGNLKALAELKIEAGSRKPAIGVNITVSAELVGHLPETLQTIREAVCGGADFYRIYHQWYVSHRELAAHQSTLSRTLGCQACSAAAHLDQAISIPDPFILADEIETLRVDADVVTFPELKREDVVDYYSDTPNLANRCIAPLLGAVIKPNGDVVFCPDAWIDDYVLGNIRSQRFEEIWNNEKARRFRAVLIKEKRFQGCNRCSWMYAY